MAMNKADKMKALDLMIVVGKGKGPKDDEGDSYKEPMSKKADMEEDMEEGEDATCSKCDAPMVCKGCDMPESECSCE